MDDDLEDPDLDELEEAGTGCGTSKPHWGKYVEDAQRCPCFNCPDRSSCLVECPAFRSYTKRGK